ncbi:MAG: hypothetical protein ACI9FR_002705 [Cryomorphaceae bacterium]|jgi:hypothetical protein
MASNKKYEYELKQTGDTWSAKVTRKINSRKRATTMQKDGFKSEAEATSWSEQSLVELTTKQKSSNLNSGQKRKDTEEMKRQRSARRAEKTELAKEEAAKLAEADDQQIAEHEEKLSDDIEDSESIDD